MNALTNFSFEDQLVRSIRIEGEVYDCWVATDAAKILQYRDAEKLVRLLDDDEASTLLEGTCGLKKGTWLLTLSGLLHAILKSRSPVAKPFRRKVTEEWLPQLLYPGKAELPGHDNDAKGVSSTDTLCVLDVAQRNSFNDSVSLATRLGGRAAGIRMWLLLGGEPIFDNPPLLGSPRDAMSDPMLPAMKAWLEGREECTIDEAAIGIRIVVGRDQIDRSMAIRVGKLLRHSGWDATGKIRIGLKPVTIFTPVPPEAGE